MWFLFGVVSTLGFVGYFAYRRLVAPWSGERLTGGVAPVEYKTFEHKRRVKKLRVGVSCPPHYDFTVRRQNALDVFFVRIGLSVEQTSGDVVFDDSLYLLSDDHRVGNRLRIDPDLRATLLGLIGSVAGHKARVAEVRCVGGRLWVDVVPTWLHSLERDRLAGLALSLSVPLQHAAARLASPADAASHADWSVLRAAALLGVSSGLAANGVLQAVRLSWDPTIPAIIDRNELHAAALVVGLGSLALLLTLAVVLLRTSSRAHGVVLELLLTGSFGALATSYTELRDFNLEVDLATVREVRAPLLACEHYACGKNKRSTCYRLSFGGGELPVQTLQVDAPTCARLAGSNEVVVDVHPGGLGFRWFSQVRPAP